MAFVGEWGSGAGKTYDDSDGVAAVEIKDMSEGCRKHLPGPLYVIFLYCGFNAKHFFPALKTTKSFFVRSP